MNEKKFWDIMDNLDWSCEGDDYMVIKPVIGILSNMKDEQIHEFDEIMSRLLYDIDGKKWAEAVYDSLEDFSDDDFLYTRCVALVNGEEYYYDIKNHVISLDSDLEFESVLYIPQLAWEEKHANDDTEYSYVTKYSFESGSNVDNW